MTLFASVHIFLDKSSLDSDTVPNLKKALQKGGAHVLDTITKQTTHIVTQDELYEHSTKTIKIVTVCIRFFYIFNNLQPLWVFDSASMKKLGAYVQQKCSVLTLL
jgi:hypothetical protein